MKTDNNKPNSIALKKTVFKSHYFESFGLKIRLSANDDEILRQLRSLAIKAAVGNIKFIDNDSAKPDFDIKCEIDGEKISIHDRDTIVELPELEVFEEYILRKIRFIIAEYAVGYVFVHAGVVAWRDRSLLLPGQSGKGKTTLTAELVKLGATYYSDEYAVIDKFGKVHPFARDLSIRQMQNGWNEKNGIPVEVLGGKAGTKPLPVNFVFFTEYSANAELQVDQISTGQGILEMINYSLPIGNNPKFTFNVLNIALENAIMIKSMRGESAQSALEILNYINNCID